LIPRFEVETFYGRKLRPWQTKPSARLHCTVHVNMHALTSLAYSQISIVYYVCVAHTCSKLYSHF
jgi:hypothetical protein